MPGPPKTPTAVQRARGNPGHRRLQTDEPQPTPTTAEPPPDLVPAALALWQQLAPEAVRIGTLTALDRDEFALGCRLRAWGAAALARAEATGGTLRPSEVQAIRDSSRIFGRFGIGASDRTRIHVAPPSKPESKWARLVS